MILRLEDFRKCRLDVTFVSRLRNLSSNYGSQLELSASEIDLKMFVGEFQIPGLQPKLFLVLVAVFQFWLDSALKSG